MEKNGEERSLSKLPIKGTQTNPNPQFNNNSGFLRVSKAGKVSDREIELEPILGIILVI